MALIENSAASFYSTQNEKICKFPLVIDSGTESPRPLLVNRTMHLFEALHSPFQAVDRLSAHGADSEAPRETSRFQGKL